MYSMWPTEHATRSGKASRFKLAVAVEETYAVVEIEHVQEEDTPGGGRRGLQSLSSNIGDLATLDNVCEDLKM